MQQFVTTVYQRIFGDLYSTCLDEFLSRDFVLHNPTAPDGQHGIKTFVQILISQEVLKQKIEFKHIALDDDFVFLHSRYENDRLAEHCDV